MVRHPRSRDLFGEDRALVGEFFYPASSPPKSAAVRLFSWAWLERWVRMSSQFLGVCFMFISVVYPVVFSGIVVNLSFNCCGLVFFFTCFGAGLAVVSVPVVDFLLGFDLCRLKSHLFRDHRTEVGWIFPPPIFGFLNEPLVCSISACNSSRCRKYARIVLLPDLSVRFTST